MTRREVYPAMEADADPDGSLERLRARIVIDDNGCWIWQGAKTVAGYGQMRHGSNRGAYAHRVSYVLHVGPIPAGKVVDHLCRRPACCNPEHLEPVDQLVNVRRGAGHGSETHCRHGHPYSGANLIVRSNGCRACKQCERDANKRRWAQYKAKMAAAGTPIRDKVPVLVIES